MQKKNMEVEFDRQTNPWKWVSLILIGIMVLDLCCFIGAMTGGLVGYAIGRKTAGSFRMMQHEYDGFPMIPDIPDYPRMPMQPLPLPEPRFDMPFEPELGTRPRLGVTFIMTDDGAEIVGVIPESPAQRFGIQIGDVITNVDGRRVTRAQSLDEHIMGYKPGDTVTLTIERDGRTRQIDVRLAAEPQG